MKRNFLLLSILFCTLLPGISQSPAFYGGFDQILDNREYITPWAKHQTIFGVRINAGVSLTFDSLHSVNAGFNYMYEFGGELLGVKPQVDLYYSYNSQHLQVYFGSFPRKDRMDLPLMILTDTLNYYRPNMEGASIRYNWDWGTVHGWVDWTGRASEKVKESILAGFDATLKAGMFYFTTIATRYHLAHYNTPEDRSYLRDDGAVMLLAGINLTGKTSIDEINISTGQASTYLWARPAKYEWFNGWYSQLDMKHGIFGLKGTYYLGDSPPLVYGDYLYHSGNYGRLDFFVDPFKNPRVSSKLGWNLHFLPGESVYHSQQILIHITF